MQNMQKMSAQDATSTSHKHGRLDVGAITNFFSDPHNSRQWWQRLFAELVGAFLLTLVAAGADVIGAATGHPADGLARYVAPALLVMRPSVTTLPAGRWRSGAKSPERSSSYSRKNPST